MKIFKFAINGAGRIGLCVARVLKELGHEVSYINASADARTLVHLINFDSVHKGGSSKFIDEEHICINDLQKIRLINERDTDRLHFEGVDCVLECSGAYNSLSKSSFYAKRHPSALIVISAPASDVPTFVHGVNHESYAGEKIISASSCTTTALAPIVKIVHEKCGVRSGLLTTIHAYTNDQNLLDARHRDLRRARAAALNLIPTSTGAANSIGLLIPELKGLLNGISIRVPTPVVSMIDVTLLVQKHIDALALNEIFRSSPLVDVDEDLRVSCDFIGSRAACTIIPDKTLSVGAQVKVLAWYDNEMGYAYKMVDLALHALGNKA